jgi:hypothetical protein
MDIKSLRYKIANAENVLDTVYIPSLGTNVQYTAPTANELLVMAKAAAYGDDTEKGIAFQRKKIDFIKKHIDASVNVDALSGIDVLHILASIIDGSRGGSTVSALIRCQTCNGGDGRVFKHDIDLKHTINICNNITPIDRLFDATSNGMELQFTLSEPRFNDILELTLLTKSTPSEFHLYYPLLYVNEITCDGEVVEGFIDEPLKSRIELFDSLSPYCLFGENSLSTYVMESFDRGETLVEAPYCDQCNKDLGPIITSDHFFTV